MPSAFDIFDIVVAAIGVMFAATLGLFGFNQICANLLFIASKEFAAQGAWQKQVQSYVGPFGTVITNLIGRSKFPLDATLPNLLAFAILIVLIGIWRSTLVQATHVEKAEQAEKKQRAAAASSK